jgi:hypothetical protein
MEGRMSVLVKFDRHTMDMVKKINTKGPMAFELRKFYTKLYI